MKNNSLKQLALVGLVSLVVFFGLGFIPPAEAEPPKRPVRVVIKFRPGIAADRQEQIMAERGHATDKYIHQLKMRIIKVPPGKTAEDVINRYKRHPLVEFVELEQYYYISLTPNDPWYANPITPQWHLHNPEVDADIDAPEAWDITTGSPDIVIAILDTGVYGEHEDLQNKMVPGWNIVEDNDDATDGAGHGTFVAGAAAAESNNAIGVASPAWGCMIMPIKVTENGWTSGFALAEGIVWAADHGAKIASMSFEMIDNSPVTTAAQYLQECGGVTVQGAGNSGTFDANPDNPYILKISGTDWYDNITSFSVTGNSIDLAAPAMGIITPTRRGTYGSATGTSLAAPIVSGVAALVYSINPDFSGEEVQDILKQSADDLGDPGWDTDYGWGRVNAYGAVELASEYEPTPDTTPPTATIISPTEGQTLSGLITVVVEATDNIGVSLVELYLDGSFISGDEVAPHEWFLDTTEYPDGEHTLSAVAYDAAGNTGESEPVVITIDNIPAENTPPVVNAGEDQQITLPAIAYLEGIAYDDGLPNPPGALTINWSKIAGPGTVTFSDASALDATATFSEAGSYTLELTASDGEYTSTDTLSVTVNPEPTENTPPVVDAGESQEITLPALAYLDGTVSDDGLPNPPAETTVEWSKLSGKGRVTITNANALDTTVSFKRPGTYVFQLTASDSQLSASDTVTIVVNPKPKGKGKKPH